MPAMTKKERNIHYFKIEYAKRGLALCEGENLSMKECAFTNNETGLKLRGNSDVTVKDCVFKGNTNSGILLGEDISGTIKDDSLYDNGVGINISQQQELLHSRTQMGATRVTPTIQAQSKVSEKDVILSKQNILTVEESKTEMLKQVQHDIIQHMVRNDRDRANVLHPELVLKGLYVSGNNTGILCAGKSTPQLKESKIINNMDYGVYITDDAEPNLGGSGHNYIYGSGTYDLYNNTPNMIMAKKNYWGTMDIDSVESHIYDYYDDNSLGVVEIEPLWNGNKAVGGTMSSGEETTPVVYFLNHPSPNPFVNKTIIAYSIAKPGKVTLNIYDISGRLIKTLVKEKKETGFYTTKWNGCDNNNRKVATSVYFARLTAGDYTSVKKVILIR